MSSEPKVERAWLEVLPCGCVCEGVYIDGVPTFRTSPCQMDCKYLQFMIEEAGLQDKPVEYRELS